MRAKGLRKKHSFTQKIFACGALAILLLTAHYSVNAQTITIVGIVTDAGTQAPLSNASVYLQKEKGAVADSNGMYQLTIPKSSVKNPVLRISLIGYRDTTYAIDTTQDTLYVNMALTQAPNTLKGVVVKTQKEKYSNKNNPAVELIRKVIEHKEENQVTAFETSEYNRYEKLIASVSNMSEKLKDKKYMQKYQFFLQNVDTTKFPGKSLLPVYLEESYSKIYRRKSPEMEKKVILGENKMDLGEFIDAQGVTSYLNRLYEDINIYDNNIDIFTNQFLSPINNIAPSFYQYFIRDTIEVDSIKVIQLAFKPRNMADLLLRGYLYITLDGHYAVQKVQMFIPPTANVNFMRELKIDQSFHKMPDGHYILETSDMIGDFGLSKKGIGLFGEKFIAYTNMTANQPISSAIANLKDVTSLQDAGHQDSAFWLQNRPVPLSIAEAKTYQNVDSLINMPSFKRTMDWISLFIAGYKQLFGGLFETGPASTFYSFNPVEGLRLRFGGRSTTHLSQRYYFETYGAYGFKDKKFKYFGSFTYSLNDKSIYKFPQDYIRASFQHDTKIPGQELQFVQESNFLLSFKRGNNDKWLYNDLARLDYVHEFENHFSMAAGYKYWKQQPAGSIDYVMPNPATQQLDTIEGIKTSELGLTLRYAPNEKFYQGKLYRIPIINEYPVYTLRYIAGIKGLTGGQYNYNFIGANIWKRFYLSPIGYSDVTFDAGYNGGKVPFPLLTIHHANQSYAYQMASFNMMNFLEFVSDHYASLFVDHYFNGFIFNKIPLMKKLKWREVIEAKVLYGGLRAENDPAKNPEQMRFPYTNNALGTFALENKPYVEAGFGIANIFKILRIDCIRRFTYLNNPDIPKWGLRFYTKFDF